MTTAAEHRAKARQHDQDAADSFDRCDTDGFVSQACSGLNAQLERARAALAEAGGVASFWRYTATDLEGNALECRGAQTRFGFKLVCELNGREVWIDPSAKRPATNRAKGVVVGVETFTAPAHACHWSPPGARGFSGLSSVSVRIFPDDRTLRFDGEGNGDGEF